MHTQYHTDNRVNELNNFTQFAKMLPKFWMALLRLAGILHLYKYNVNEESNEACSIRLLQEYALDLANLELESMDTEDFLVALNKSELLCNHHTTWTYFLCANDITFTGISNAKPCVTFWNPLRNLISSYPRSKSLNIFLAVCRPSQMLLVFHSRLADTKRSGIPCLPVKHNFVF